MAYDAIIVGGRVAGAATGMLLARSGYRVLVADRATFPSDTISTHIVWQRGVSHLIEWGLAEQLQATNCPSINRLEFDVGPFALVAALPAVGEAKDAYAPRRKVLDTLLIEAASEAGADVREGCSVDELIFDGDRVAGIRGRSRTGDAMEARGTVVVGADGVHSMVARTVGPIEYNIKPTLTFWYYSYWSGFANRGVRYFSREGRVFGCIPTNDGLTCVVVAWPHDRFVEVKKDIEGHFLATFDMAPAFKEEVMSGKREERFYGTADIPNYFRKPYGPGWALVGDSGYHKDPILAQGISDAFRDASLLAGALDDVFTGRALWEGALSGYESARNAAVGAIYEMNAQFAALEPPPPEMQMLLAALRGNQDDINQFAGTMTGAVPVAEFYAPGNVRRILDSASQSARLHATG